MTPHGIIPTRTRIAMRAGVATTTAFLATVVAATPALASGDSAGHGNAGHDMATMAGPALWPWVLVAAAGAVMVYRLLSRLTRGTRQPRGWTDYLAAATLFLSGVAHCIEAPAHWAAGRHLGLFFAAAAALLLAQAATVAARPSRSVYMSVLASTTVLLTLYFAARTISLPLVPSHGEYLASELWVKGAELVAAGVAITRIRQLKPAIPLPTAP